MEKMKQQPGQKTPGPKALLLIAIMILTSILVLSAFAESGGCDVSGNIHEGILETFRYINNSTHEYICAYCGELVRADHVGDDFVHEIRSKDSKTHASFCYLCKKWIDREHTFDDNGVCYYCGYVRNLEEMPRVITATPTSGGSATPKPTGSNNGSNSNDGTGFVLPKKPGRYAVSGKCKIGGKDREVLIQILGLCRSYIFVDDEPMFVYTEDLEITEGLPREQRLAYIKTSGHARLYKDPDFKKSLGLRCSPGTILPVVSVGDNYIQVQYNGKTGYMKRTSVELSGPREGLGTGLVDNNNKTVNIRVEMNQKSARVVAVKSGTEMTIISETDHWYEVEYNSLHGYVRKEFMKIKERGFGEEAKATKETANAEATPAPAAAEAKTESSTEIPEEGSALIYRDDHVTLTLMNAAAEGNAVTTEIRAAATDCVCYLFAFTSAEITEGHDEFHVTKKYADTTNGRFWDLVTTEAADRSYRWETGIAYDQPFITEYAASMKYNYYTIGCTLSDSRVSQPVGFTVLEARKELDIESLLEGRITLESLGEDIIQAFHLHINTP